MKHVSLRWLLAVTQVALYAGLVVFGLREQVGPPQMLPGWIEYRHPPYSPAFAWAIGINLPAFVMSVPLLIAVIPTLEALAIPADAPTAVIIGAWVAFFWFWVGKRLETAYAGQDWPIMGRSLFVRCSLIAMASLVLFAALRRVYMIEMKLSMFGWIVVGIWALVSMIKRARHSRSICGSSSDR
jgi:hypothetical protein